MNLLLKNSQIPHNLMEGLEDGVRRFSLIIHGLKHALIVHGVIKVHHFFGDLKQKKKLCLCTVCVCVCVINKRVVGMYKDSNLVFVNKAPDSSSDLTGEQDDQTGKELQQRNKQNKGQKSS